MACCYPRSAEEEHASPQPPAPYLAGAGARAGIPRHGAGQATRTANQVSGVGSLRSPEGRVRTARGDRSSPNAELERGCGVCAAAQCRTRAGGSGFGCCGRLPPRCSAGPARRLRGAETLATRRKPGPDLEWTQGGLGAGNRCRGRWGAGGGVRAPGPAQLGGLKSGRRDFAPCPGWAAGLRVGGA